MVALIPWGISPLYAFGAALLLYGLGRLLLLDVRKHALTHASFNPDKLTASTVGIWLFCLAGVAFIASPASIEARVSGVFMLCLMLRIAVSDALTCEICRYENGMFIVAGIVSSQLLNHSSIMATAIMGMNCYLWAKLTGKRSSSLATGDLILLTGMAAWFGLGGALLVLSVAGVAFIAWHCTWCFGKKNGPFAPWLCIAGLLHQLNTLYQPSFVSI